MTSEQRMWEWYESFKDMLASICEDKGMEPTDKMFLLILISRFASKHTTPRSDMPDDVVDYIKRVDSILALEETKEDTEQ